ncbi:hypothetical protein Tco_0662775 [Tanacetum coccineum]
MRANTYHLYYHHFPFYLHAYSESSKYSRALAANVVELRDVRESHPFHHALHPSGLGKRLLTYYSQNPGCEVGR